MVRVELKVEVRDSVRVTDDVELEVRLREVLCEMVDVRLRVGEPVSDMLRVRELVTLTASVEVDDFVALRVRVPVRFGVPEISALPVPVRVLVRVADAVLLRTQVPAAHAPDPWQGVPS